MYQGLGERKGINVPSGVKVVHGNEMAQRKNVQKEKKIKRNWKKCLQDYWKYCLMTTTAHGFVHLVRPGRHKYERWFWFIVIILATIPCYMLGSTAFHHYFKHPTVMSLERDHWAWDMDFPAMTICTKSLNITEVQIVADERGMDVSYVNEFFEILFLTNFTQYDQLERFGRDFDWLDPEDYLEYNRRFVFAFSEKTNIKRDELKLKSVMIVTEFGICYQISSRLVNYNTFEYLQQRERKLVDLLPGERTNAAAEEQTLNIDNINGSVMLFVHSSTEVIDIKTRSSLFIPPSYFGSLTVSITSTVTPKEVKKLSIEQRDCRFMEESNLKYFAIYTHNLCFINCRIELALRLCGCMPYYYNNIYNEKTCDIQGMICLNNYQYFLTQLEDINGHSLCSKCFMNCNEDRVSIVQQSLGEWISDAGSVLQVILKHISPVRYKRTLIFTETDLLVQVGGLVGLCFGLSVLSLVELFYFLTLRFYFGVIRPRRP